MNLKKDYFFFPPPISARTRAGATSVSCVPLPVAPSSKLACSISGSPGVYATTGRVSRAYNNIKLIIFEQNKLFSYQIEHNIGVGWKNNGPNPVIFQRDVGLPQLSIRSRLATRCSYNVKYKIMFFVI